MTTDRFSIAIDIGAGLGVKIGLFSDPQNQFGDALLPREEFEASFEGLTAKLLDKLEQLLKQHDRRLSDARGIGIASPGLFRSDGSYLLAANLPFLSGQNLKQRLADATGLPTAIDNDANVGRVGRMVGDSDRPAVLGLRRRLGRRVDRSRRGPSSFRPWTGTATTGRCTTPTSRATRFRWTS